MGGFFEEENFSDLGVSGDKKCGFNEICDTLESVAKEQLARRVMTLVECNYDDDLRNGLIPGR